MSDHAFYLLRSDHRFLRLFDRLENNHPNFVQDIINIGNAIIAIILASIIIGFIIFSQLYI